MFQPEVKHLEEIVTRTLAYRPSFCHNDFMPTLEAFERVKSLINDTLKHQTLAIFIPSTTSRLGTLIGLTALSMDEADEMSKYVLENIQKIYVKLEKIGKFYETYADLDNAIINIIMTNLNKDTN